MKEKIGKNPLMAGTDLETSLLIMLSARNKMAKALINPDANPIRIRLRTGKLTPRGIKRNAIRNHKTATLKAYAFALGIEPTRK